MADKGTELLKSFLSKAGPFVGPRGGKWADAKHTIPWSDKGGKGSSGSSEGESGDTSSSKAGEKFKENVSAIKTFLDQAEIVVSHNTGGMSRESRVLQAGKGVTMDRDEHREATKALKVLEANANTADANLQYGAARLKLAIEKVGKRGIPTNVINEAKAVVSALGDKGGKGGGASKLRTNISNLKAGEGYSTDNLDKIAEAEGKRFGMNPAEVKKEINALLKEGVLERKDGGISKKDGASGSDKGVKTKSEESKEEHFTPAGMEPVYPSGHKYGGRIYYDSKEGKYYDRNSDMYLHLDFDPVKMNLKPNQV